MSNEIIDIVKNLPTSYVDAKRKDDWVSILEKNYIFSQMDTLYISEEGWLAIGLPLGLLSRIRHELYRNDQIQLYLQRLPRIYEPSKREQQLRTDKTVQENDQPSKGELLWTDKPFDFDALAKSAFFGDSSDENSALKEQI